MKKLLAYILFLVFIVLHTGCASPMASAVSKGDNNTVKELLDKGADVNERVSHNVAYGMNINRNYPLLILAVENGHGDIVKILLDKRADIEASFPFFFKVSKPLDFFVATRNANMTALTMAALKGHPNIIKILIDKGADVERAMAILEPIAAEPDPSRNKIIVDARAGVKLLEKYIKKEETSILLATNKTPREVSFSTPAVNSDVDELPAIKAKPNKNSYAIVIGIENYHQKLPKADFATHDAQTITEYLTKALGYQEENVVTLLNENATNVAMAKYFEKWMPNNVEPGSTVFVYYSGHGAPNTKTGDAYLVPYDGDPSFIDETGYSLKRMYVALGKLPAKEVIVALDSCFSGAGGRSVIAKGSRPLVMNLNTAAALPKNMTVLSASAGDQTSSTYDEKGHGLFTYFMLKGIKNEDVTRPDGSLKIGDLYGYIKPQVERIARKQFNNEQTPQLIEPRH
jgi:hypothetical protein